ncbi:MAG: hypothetical protein LBV67_03840, partial [Streptococcaceae bacterium]|nr:hypothetical protein [Streptococcaceae bacterium]
AAYGSVLGDISTFIAGNAMLSHAFSGQKNVVEAFIPFIMVIMSIIATIPVITITLRGVSEEKHGFLDQILGNAVSRTKVLGSYGLHAFVASFFLLFANGFGFWLSGSQVMENPIALSTFLQASLVYLPALWVFIGLSILLSGWFPKATLVVWIYLVYTFFVTYIGQMLDLADIFKQLTPFGSVPNLPVDEMNWLYFIVMSIIALILTVIGLVGYRRRDISH